MSNKAAMDALMSIEDPFGCGSAGSAAQSLCGSRFAVDGKVKIGRHTSATRWNSERRELLLRLALTIHGTIPCVSTRTGAVTGAAPPAVSLTLPFALAAALTETWTFGARSALRTVAAIFF